MQVSVLCVLIFWVDSFSFWTKLVAGSVMGLIGAFLLLGLGYVLLKQVPVEASPSNAALKPTHKTIGTLVGVGIGLIPLVMTGQDLLRLVPGALDIKVGGLCVAAGFLLQAWLDEVNGQPVIDKLLLLRRELVLGGVSIEEASTHIEIEFLGMRVSDVFRDSAIDFIKRAARISSRCVESIARIDGIGSLPSRGIGRPVALAPQQHMLAQTLLEACQPHLAAVVEDLNELGSSFQRIESRGRFFLRSTDDAQAAMNEILAKLRQSHHQAYTNYQELERRMSWLSILVATPNGANSKGAVEELPQGESHPQVSG